MKVISNSIGWVLAITVAITALIAVVPVIYILGKLADLAIWFNPNIQPVKEMVVLTRVK